MKNPTFKIGEWVETNTIVIFGYKENKRIPIKYNRQVIGQIVGATYRHTGEYSSGYSGGGLGYYNYEEYDEPALIGEGRILVWQIKPGYLNKPVEALERDIIPLKYLTLQVVYEIYKLPWLHTRNKWPQWAKDKLSEESKSWPRDEKGRWKKYEKRTL